MKSPPPAPRPSPPPSPRPPPPPACNGSVAGAPPRGGLQLSWAHQCDLPGGVWGGAEPPIALWEPKSWGSAVSPQPHPHPLPLQPCAQSGRRWWPSRPYCWTQPTSWRHGATPAANARAGRASLAPTAP
jgi:hypothetical protein